MPLTMNSNQRAAASIAYFDAAGMPAAVAGTPVWVSSDVAVFTIEPDGSGMAAVVRATANGTATLTVTVNADMAGGSRDLVVTETVTISEGGGGGPGGEAQSGKITFGMPEAK